MRLRKKLKKKRRSKRRRRKYPPIRNQVKLKISLIRYIISELFFALSFSSWSAWLADDTNFYRHSSTWTVWKTIQRLSLAGIVGVCMCVCARFILHNSIDSNLAHGSRFSYSLCLAVVLSPSSSLHLSLFLPLSFPLPSLE